MLERWIAEAPFRAAAAPAQSDLDVARGAHAQEILEHHWDTWVTAQDWAWLAERGINTVRIPVRQYRRAISASDGLDRRAHLLDACGPCDR